MAFYVILHRIEDGQLQVVGVDALMYENELTADTERKKRVKTYLERASGFVELSDLNTRRAQELVDLGFKSLDPIRGGPHPGSDQANYLKYLINYDRIALFMALECCF